MVDYFKSVPIETYQKVLLRLDSEDLKILCKTDRYVQNICQDNYFIYQYINFNYDSYEYGYDSWVYDKNLDWKNILTKVSSHKKLLEVSDYHGRKKLDKMIAMHENDTIADLINRSFRLYKLIVPNTIVLNINLAGSDLKISSDFTLTYRPHSIEEKEITISPYIKVNSRNIAPDLRLQLFDQFTVAIVYSFEFYSEDDLTMFVSEDILVPNNNII